MMELGGGWPVRKQGRITVLTIYQTIPDVLCSYFGLFNTGEVCFPSDILKFIIPLPVQKYLSFCYHVAKVCSRFMLFFSIVLMYVWLLRSRKCALATLV